MLKSSIIAIEQLNFTISVRVNTELIKLNIFIITV